MQKYLVEIKLNNGELFYDEMESEKDIKDFNKVVATTVNMLPWYTIFKEGNAININVSQVAYFNLKKID